MSGSLDPKVDGEAFHITDRDPLPFWTFSQMIWRTAGDKATPDQVITISGWLALSHYSWDRQFHDGKNG
ncbi:hypothetical protein ABVK25_004070 [Lepraria finkii]|uniref:Uncharacterized protein n=1 Tax=Lepraria finkii TaxID=1340010 RepID=A0ABR4BD98_9LECA